MAIDLPAIDLIQTVFSAAQAFSSAMVAIHPPKPANDRWRSCSPWDGFWPSPVPAC